MNNTKCAGPPVHGPFRGAVLGPPLTATRGQGRSTLCLRFVLIFFSGTGDIPCGESGQRCEVNDKWKLLLHVVDELIVHGHDFALFLLGERDVDAIVKCRSGLR